MNQSALQLLAQAQQAVKSGRKQEAYQLLLQAAKQDPQEYLIWLGLAGLTESPELSLKFVAQAEKLQPHEPKVLQAKGWAEQRLQAKSHTEAEPPTQPFLAPRPATPVQLVVAPAPKPALVAPVAPLRALPLVEPVRPAPDSDSVHSAVAPVAPARSRGRIVLFAAAGLILILLIFFATTLFNPKPGESNQPIAAAFALAA